MTNNEEKQKLDGISWADLLEGDKNLYGFFRSLINPIAEIKNILNISKFWLVRIDRTIKKNFRIYAIQRDEKRVKRQFKGHKVYEIDLSRILDPSLRFIITPYSCRLASEKLVKCILGVEENTKRIIAQFYHVNNLGKGLNNT